MSGIPIYTQSPLNAPSKASGVTPQTAAPNVEASPVAPQYVPATTTSIPTSSYPPARPGAAAFPAPTGTAAQRYAPLQPTKTTSSEAERPPPPQPGAAPIPSSRNVPPPKDGETFRPEQTSAPQPPTSRPLPSQMSIPPPSSAFGGPPPTSSTATSNTPSSSYPVQIPSTESGGPRRSLEHPPGYHQNVYASDQTSEQRRAQETINASSALGGRESTENFGAMDSGSIWNTAKKWTQQAGEKISEAEAEVWRKINKG
ncbi:hypothetical protein LHYA1_G008618 [Lachnellula hyalina]|uniref:Uncharacterized protein n=1 Tax=Lachnellula hyalina TaxID=1316788 RepID=A0A8H8QU49_9HELO|nr:uncharacterized protein LHYA1_G008618 [Lachnellula hyalina]TVY22828.1 hypothetical protein LHYA1_G008618 [Lachnellula hyalina]